MCPEQCGTAGAPSQSLAEGRTWQSWEVPGFNSRHRQDSAIGETKYRSTVAGSPWRMEAYCSSLGEIKLSRVDAGWMMLVRLHARLGDTSLWVWPQHITWRGVGWGV